MRNKDTALRDREPLPPMLVGEAEGDASVLEMDALVAAQEQAAAALLPNALSVVIERSSARRLLLIAAGMLSALAGDVLLSAGMYNLEGQVLFGGLLCAALAWLANRYLVRRRREFRLADDGMVVEVTPLAGGAPVVTRVPWTEIVDYDVSVDHEKAILRVLSAQGFTLTLQDRPPRLATRELIRRFVEQAELHPRAVPARARGAWLRDVTGEYRFPLGLTLALLAFTAGSAAVETFLEPSVLQETALRIAMILVVFGVLFLWELDDPEIARNDATSTGLDARLRRWLRRVLRIRPR